MSQSQKRSSGGYGLRLSGGKKHLNQDYDYYCSKNVTSPDSTLNMALSTPFRVSCKRSRGRPSKVVSLGNRLTVKNGSTSVQVPECNDERRVLFVDQHGAPSTEVDESVKTGIYVDNNHNNQDAVHRLLEAAKQSGPDLLSSNNDEALKENFIVIGDNDEAMIVLGSDGVSRKEISKQSMEKVVGINSEEDIDIAHLRPEDKIECSACHKLLKPGSIRQHLRTHSGEKPFNCEMCDAHFTRKGDVDRHIRIVHHKQKPYQCQHCLRAFGDKKNLRWHLENHDKKLFYVCSVCGFKFGKREYYENHVRFLHPEQKIGAGDLKVAKEERHLGALDDMNSIKLVSLEGVDLSTLMTVSENGNELSVKLPQMPEPEGVETVVIQFSEDGSGDGTNSEPPSALMVPNSFDFNQSEERMFGMVIDDDQERDCTMWDQPLDSLSVSMPYREWNAQTHDGNASQVIKLVMCEQPNPNNIQYIFKDGEEAQVMQFLGSESENNQLLVGDGSTLILNQDPGSLVQFVVNDCEST